MQSLRRIDVHEQSCTPAHHLRLRVQRLDRRHLGRIGGIAVALRRRSFYVAVLVWVTIQPSYVSLSASEAYARAL